MTIDITPEAVECLWEDYLTAALPDGGENTGVIELYDIEGMNDAAHSMFETLCALSAALTASQAETAAAYEVAAGFLDKWAASLSRMNFPDTAPIVEQCSAMIRALTPADSKAAIDLIIAEARADALSGSWDDKPDALTAAIEASHPHYTKDYKTYTDALDLVSNRHSKGALVGLVNYLLAHNKAIAADSEAALDRMIADAEARGMRKALDAASDYTQRVYGDGWTFLSNPTDRDRILAAIPKGKDHE